MSLYCKQMCTSLTFVWAWNHNLFITLCTGFMERRECRWSYSHLAHCYRAGPLHCVGGEIMLEFFGGLQIIWMGRVSPLSWPPVFRLLDNLQRIQVGIYWCWNCALLHQLDVSTLEKTMHLGFGCCSYSFVVFGAQAHSGQSSVLD